LVATRDASVKPAIDRLMRDADDALAGTAGRGDGQAYVVAAERKQARLLQPEPILVAGQQQAEWASVHPKDGVTNPESKRDLDQPRVAALGEHVQALALAYYLTGSEKYAARAAQQIRTWFLDSATSMTPHLRFSQLVRGLDQERGSGIIDTRWFIEVADAIGLLGGSKSWTNADQRGMERWFRRMRHGCARARMESTSMRRRTITVPGLLLRRRRWRCSRAIPQQPRELVNEAKARIGWQITAAGEQPIEMERTRSMHYSGFNVDALSRLAEIGRLLGIDLWHYQAPEGGSLRKAIDHLASISVIQANGPVNRSLPSSRRIW
jgi:hypothetical protein